VEVKTMLNNSLKGYGQVLLERGERKGRMEGEQRKALEIVRNLKSFGSTIDQIARAAGLPDDVIAKL
jgi:predicted transposase/invertase (TIGR01784 family)